MDGSSSSGSPQSMCHSGGTQVRPPAVAVRDRPIELPDDELRLIFELLCCHALGVLSGVSRRWHILAQDCARARLIVARRIVPPAVSPLFSLGAFATLERFVGSKEEQPLPSTSARLVPTVPPQGTEVAPASLSTAAASSASSLPSHRYWRSEWPRRDLERFTCKFAWALEMRENPLRYPREDAECLSILYTCGNGAIACAVRERSHKYPLSVHALSEYLLAANMRMRTSAYSGAPHPPVYANLMGRGGLAHDDSVWECLFELTPRDVGSSSSMASRSAATLPSAEGARSSFRTYGMCLALASNEQSDGVVWAGRPAATERSRGIVCFRARPTDALGIHGLVAVGSGRYLLPPLAIVTLERVDEPGEWHFEPFSFPRSLDREHQKCPLYTVSVAWA